MNFVFAADNNYLPHFETVLKSVMCYHENVNVFLFHSEEISSYFLDKMVYYLKKRNSKLFHYFLNEHTLAGLQGNGRFTNAAYGRYFVSRLFPYQNDHRWCYLDIDIVVNDNLTHVFEQMETSQNQPYAIAAVEDALPWSPAHYFNSGVLFFNSDLWNLDENKLIQTTLNNPQFKYADQDALNLLIGENYLHLTPSYNYQFRHAYPDMIQFINGEKNQFVFPKIIHYTESVKPWHRGDDSMVFWLFDNLTTETERYQTEYLHFANLHDFYASLSWNAVVNMPLNYFRPMVKQLYLQNFDYVVKGKADVELIE
ncbi:glycosyltransferase family 8 protein [Lonepinella sp. BR2357]|uniref:glycosyltransferase family 8 protein n=1 Tax=Lonepinella sp. BR2357 TaxID=3434549 RepID=UPI003F6DC323